METLMSERMTKSTGSDMVIGANDGISFDPAWFFGYWSKVPQHTITWVEPNPTLFKRLTANTVAIPNKVRVVYQALALIVSLRSIATHLM